MQCRHCFFIISQLFVSLTKRNHASGMNYDSKVLNKATQVLSPHPLATLVILTGATMYQDMTKSTKYTIWSSAWLPCQSGMSQLSTQLQTNKQKQQKKQTNPQEKRMHKQSIFAILTQILQSSPLHHQPSRRFELLHTTLQLNNYTSSSFPVTLWPWVNIKVI